MQSFISKGIAFFVLSQFCLVIDGLAAHHVGPQGLNIYQLTLLRGLGSVVVAFLFVPGLGVRIFATKAPLFQLLRGTLTLVSLWLIYYALIWLPLADAAALNQTRPIWMALMGVFLLGESVSLTRLATMMIAAIGAIAIVNPGFASWNPVYIIAVLGAIISSGTTAVNRHLNRTDSPATTILYFSLVLIVGSVPALLEPIPWHLWRWFPVVAGAGGLTTWFGIVASQTVDLTFQAAYDNLRLPITILLGVVLFTEIPTPATLLGSLLIIGPGLLLFGMERQKMTAVTL